MSDNELLLNVLSEVFEGFAFMFVEAEPDHEPHAPGDCLQAEIEFSSGQIRGRLEVIAPVQLCGELALNILGADEESLPDGAGQSALEEVLNVSCGCLLAERFGTETVFDLSIPEARMIPEASWEVHLEARKHSLFLVEDMPMLVRLVLKGSAHG